MKELILTILFSLISIVAYSQKIFIPNIEKYCEFKEEEISTDKCITKEITDIFILFTDHTIQFFNSESIVIFQIHKLEFKEKKTTYYVTDKDDIKCLIVYKEKSKNKGTLEIYSKNDNRTYVTEYISE